MIAIKTVTSNAEVFAILKTASNGTGTLLASVAGHIGAQKIAKPTFLPTLTVPDRFPLNIVGRAKAN